MSFPALYQEVHSDDLGDVHISHTLKVNVTRCGKATRYGGSLRRVEYSSTTVVTCRKCLGKRALRKKVAA